MLSIQDVGLSVFSDKPKRFYIFGGSEYGIKEKYIDILVSKIGPKSEYQTVSEVINLMSKYQIIPLPPQVYVVRYDKTFISTAVKEVAEKILTLPIIGTLVLIYEDAKDVSKLDKVFPDNTAVIDAIDDKHMTKYLKSDFPELDKKTIEYAVKHSSNYYQAKNICRCLDAVKDKMLLTESQMVSLFGLQATYSNDDVQVAIASRNFRALAQITDHYGGDLNNILYLILRTMTELDKIQGSKYSNSPLKEYAKKWSRPDIYYMFNHTYEAIKAMRNGCTVELPDLITYLGALMMFKAIPSIDMLK